MNVYMTAHDDRYRAAFAGLAARAAGEFPDVRLRVLFARPAPERSEAPHEHYLLPRDFPTKLEQVQDLAALHARLARFGGRVPLDLFRSDMRLVLRERTADMLAMEQAALSEALEALFAEAPPDLFFASSGTNIVHSVGYHLASAAGAKAYRIHSYLNLNLNHEGQRVWFCANNRMSLSESPEDRFDYDPAAVEARIRALHDAVRSRAFKLDDISKRYRQRRMPVTPRQLARDVGRLAWFASPIHPRGSLARLKANPHRDRLRVLANGRRNRRLTLPPGELSERFVLFALNTPYDSQILVRAPEYRDFLSLVELVAGLTPYGYDLVLREHPAFLGMLDHARLAALQTRHPHVKLVSSDAPFPAIVAKARAVLIINNTAFVDAILAGKPVISLANGYFQGRGLTREIGHLQELRQAFDELVRGDLDGDRTEALARAMSDLFQETWPGPDVRADDKQTMIMDGVMAKLRRIAAVHGGLDAFCRRLRCGGEAP
ncbi:hypothetical protein [Salinarimonas sp.]|uniref:capsular polysaccharide export protein, LipB/KpsS family n=1 Tax=Salinarimonas sp. TaxID=2766526 RepID=UPI0032D8FD7D